MQARDNTYWKTIRILLLCSGLYLFLIWGALHWSGLLATPGILAHLSLPGDTGSPPPLYPFLELWKLLISAVLGMVITTVHKHYHRDKPLSRSMEQAQILLCVSGAMMMIIIGDSLARAFGILGVAAIIRFRTPVEDPKDTTILFLVLGIGMSCGLASFGVAGLATAFLCLVLFVLDHMGEQKPRAMMLELVAEGPEFPTQHVQNIFAAYGMTFEPREVLQGKEAMIKYHVVLAPNTSLEYLSDQLMSGGHSGIKSVVWALPKKGG